MRRRVGFDREKALDLERIENKFFFFHESILFDRDKDESRARFKYLVNLKNDKNQYSLNK